MRPQSFLRARRQISTCALVLGTVAVLLSACAPIGIRGGATTSGSSDAAQRRELRIGDAAPDFALPDQNRQEVRLSSFRGKTVQVAFYVWALSGG